MKTALSIIVVFFIFVSCSKTNLAEYRKSPGIDLRFCNIKTWSDTHGDVQRTNIFTYNEFENPVSVTSNQSGTGSGRHFFTYDDQHRLAGYEYEYVFVKQFKYAGSVRRSHGAQVTDLYGREFLETYTYDDRNRIIKSVLELVSTPYEVDDIPTETKEYVYLNDDLNSIIMNGEQVNPDVEYSNRPSVYMTNKVWQFINQNYSRHSVKQVSASNRLGLPLAFDEGQYEFPFLDISGAGSEITYHCR